MQVSIHTPTKGVTSVCQKRLRCTSSFNPHTHEGCDVFTMLCHKRLKSFNPHTHEGCDYTFCWCVCFLAVSIHTPTKGVTYKHLLDLNIQQFQSTHPRRVWLDASVSLQRSQEFQSTHPRRVWRIMQEQNRFNADVSIHTPTKGVTDVSSRSATGFKFQSTHPRRVWRYGHVSEQVVASFNPHTHEGCDLTPNTL